MTYPCYFRGGRADGPVRGAALPLASRHLRSGGTSAVVLRYEVHLIRGQLRRDGAHLLVDVVLAKPLRERRELALDIGRLLRLQLRRTELVVAGTCMRRKAESRRVGSPAKTRRMAGLSSRRVCPT